MSCREILTLQFGHYSNFVGTHWWNIQEQSFEYNSKDPSEVNHDVLYREGITDQRQVTFTPRLLLVDLHGSLNSLPERGDIYEQTYKEKGSTSKVGIEWEESKVDVQKISKVEKTKFQIDLENEENLERIQTKQYDFENEVKVWSDFLYGRFHPRTVNLVKEFQHGNELTPFDAYPLGLELWRTEQFQEDFSDKIRNYVEECDHFQGFHILTDSTNGFAGLTSSCLEHIRDDYDRKSVLVFPLIPSHFTEYDDETDKGAAQSLINDSVRVLNLALGITNFSSHSNLCVPLSTGETGWRQPGPKRSLQEINYNEKLAYHTSAVLATALDTVTLKYRLRQTNFSLMDLCADLNQHGRKIGAASVRMPFPMALGSNLLDCLDSWQGPLHQSITPRCSIGTDQVLQHITLRGIGEEQLKKPINQAENQRDLHAYKCNTIEEMMQMYLSYSTHATASNVTVVRKPLGVKNPFPKFFDGRVGVLGQICQRSRPAELNVESIPVLAGLHSSAEIGEVLESLHAEARRIKIGRFHQFLSGGLSKDDFEDCLDNLFTLRENYEDSYLV